jgi:hypothetical protein
MGLCGFFVICVLLLPFITNSLNTEADMEYRSLADPARIFAWKMFIHASYQQPFFGFGWGPLAGASFLVVEQYPGQPGLFLQAHNLILDIILWNGYPLGLLIVSIILWWVWRACTLMRTFGQLHLLAFLVVLGTHAMLEYPLQYAIFLLPFGLVVGVLHVDLGMEVVCEGRPWQWASLLLIAALALFVTIKDYFRVENSFYGLRFESKKIKTDIPSAPPEVFALTQFRDHLLLARNIPQSGLSTSDLRWMTDTVNTLPSYLVMYKLAANLALNGRAEDARHWQIRICKTMAAGNCSNMRETWKKDAANNPAMGVFALSEDDIR